MRKMFFAILLFAGLAEGSAQLHLGAKAGANLTKIDGEAFRDKFALGYQLGGYAYYDFSKAFGLQLEVQFNQSNTKIEERYSEVLFNVFDKKKKLNYISVPVLLRLNTKGLITIVGGPQFSFLANSDETTLQNSKRLFKKTDFGLVAGVEVNFKPFILYGRYTWGFSKISEIGDSPKSRQIQIGLAANIF
ncbi:porin family protein [Chryseobacterium paridis]|uniref:PorT family protein n=1 Tax=Chryseobacterium paridis TaxID=2800328 RepID=A0ABS1FV45_9FLAO|nr:porin family protein [Chryseobacterium paridis]MBK1896218.1 PorT family protein [Chryseobacterium paridis]